MMSSRSHCAVDIIAKFIDVATKPHGGQRSASMPLGAANALWRETHPLT